MHKKVREGERCTGSLQQGAKVYGILQLSPINEFKPHAGRLAG